MLPQPSIGEVPQRADAPLVEFASLGRRLAADAIDFVLLVVAAIVQFGIGFVAHFPFEGYDQRGASIFWICCSNLIVFAIIARETLTARTIGKRAVGICVRSHDGTPATNDRVFLRTALKYLAPLVFWLAFVPLAALTRYELPHWDAILFALCVFGAPNVLGFLHVFLSPDRSSVIDVLTGTAVFRDISAEDLAKRPTFGFPVITAGAGDPREAIPYAPLTPPGDETRNP